MKKIFTLLFMVMVAANCHAQLLSENVNLKWSKTSPTKKAYTIQKVVAEAGENLIMVMSKEKEDMHGVVRNPIFQKFDPDFNLILSQPLSTGEYPGKFIFEKLISFQGELIMVYSSIQPLKSDYSLYFQKIDVNTLKPVGTSTLVAAIKLPSFMNPDRSNRVKVLLSPDKENIMFFMEYPHERTATVKAEMAIYDSGLNPNWSHLVEIPHTHQFFSLGDLKLDNQARVYLTGILTNSKREVAETNKPVSQFEVMSFDKTGKTQQTTLSSKQGQITDLILAFGKSEELICAGLYTENDKDISSSAGTYIAKLDLISLATITENHSPYTEDFLYHGTTKKQKNSLEKDFKKGKQPELDNYRLDKIHTYSDGSFTLISEQRNNSTQTSISSTPSYAAVQGQQMSSKLVFSYQNMLVTKFDAEGKTQWISKILKNQLSENDGGFYSSYAVNFHNDKIYLIFNDHPDNYNFDDKKGLQPFRVKLGKKAPLSIVELDEEGSSTKKLLALTGDTKVFARPKVFANLSNGELLLYGKLKNKQRFGILSFEDFISYQ